MSALPNLELFQIDARFHQLGLDVAHPTQASSGIERSLLVPSANTTHSELFSWLPAGFSS